MSDTLRTQLDLQMGEVRTRVTRPTALFDFLIQWGESAIRERGPASLGPVIATCSHWWMDHRPDHRHRPAREQPYDPSPEAWDHLCRAIDSLLDVGAEHAEHRTRTRFYDPLSDELFG